MWRSSHFSCNLNRPPFAVWQYGTHGWQSLFWGSHSLWRKHFVSIVRLTQKESKNQIWFASDSFHGSLHILFSLNSEETNQRCNSSSLLRLTAKKNFTHFMQQCTLKGKACVSLVVKTSWKSKSHADCKSRSEQINAIHMYVLTCTFEKRRGRPRSSSGYRQPQTHWVGIDWCQVMPSPHWPSCSNSLCPSPPTFLSVQGNQMTALPTPEVPVTLFAQIAQLTSVVKSNSERLFPAFT